jgi:hypothetical protein
VTSVQSFYDDLAPLYHLVYENWEATVARQGTALASLIGEEWGAALARCSTRRLASAPRRWDSWRSGSG